MLRSNPDSFTSSIDSLLSVSTSSEKPFPRIKKNLVKQEALNLCGDKVWSSFLCVIENKIFTLYPDFSKPNYRMIFNQSVFPQTHYYNIIIPLLPSKIDDEKGVFVLFCSVDDKLFGYYYFANKS